MNDAQREAMQPCPFCGGDPEVIGCSVHCNNPLCEAQPFTAGQSEAEAIAAWNRRASDDLLLQAAEALQDVIGWVPGNWHTKAPMESVQRARTVAAALRQRIGRGK
jgi:hypothetical protein